MSQQAKNKLVFKYKTNHDTMECDCPDLKKCQPGNSKSYRIVHSDLDHKNNYTPPILIIPRTFKTCNETCGGYALSFFNSADNAETHFKRVSGFSPKFVNTVGNCIAECDLKVSDGVVSKPNDKGHFDLHEYNESVFKDRFTIIRTIAHEKTA